MELDYVFTNRYGEEIRLKDLIEVNDNNYDTKHLEGLNKLSNRTIGTEAYNINRVQCELELEKLEDMDELAKQMSIFECTGDFLDSKGEPLGVSREPAAPSTVTLVLTIPEPLDYDLIFEEGTIVFTDDSVSFSFDEDCIITQGELSNNVSATSELTGSVTNVEANTINIFELEPDEQVTVTNPQSAVGGLDEEEDEDYRMRILDAPNNHPTGSAAWYRLHAMLNDNVSDARFVNTPLDVLNTALLYFKPVNETDASNTLSELISYFEKDEYNIIGQKLKIEQAEGIQVLHDTQIRVLLDHSIDETTATNQIVNMVNYYMNDLKLKGLYKPVCMEFFIETIPGVNVVNLVGGTEVQANDNQYFYANTSDLDIVFVEL